MPSESAPPALAQLWGKLAGSGAKFFRDLGLLVAGQVAAKFVGVLAFAYLARVLDPESYGEVEFVVGLAGLFGMVVDLGLTTIGVRRAAAAPERRGELATQVFLIRFAVAVLCALVMIAGVNIFGGSPALHGLVTLYALSLLFSAFYQEWLLQSAGLMAQIALAQIFRMLVFFAAILLLVRGVENAVLVGVCEIAGIIAAAAFALYVQRKKIAPVRLWTRFEDASLIREALPVALGTMIWSAAQYAPLFLMGSLVGGAGVGFYAGAARLAASVAQFSFVYHFNLYATASRMARVSAAALATLMRSSFRTMAWTTIGGGLFVTLAAQPIMEIIFGREFGAAATSLAILIWTVPVMFLAGHARWSLILDHKEVEVFRSQVVGLITVAGLGLILVPRFHETGAAAAGLGGGMGVWVSSYVLAWVRKVETPPLMLAARPLLLAGALALGTVLIALPVWIEAVGAVALYAVAAPLIDRSLWKDVLHLARAGHLAQ
ncbi:oligosaccharide flippase family protein [Sphingomonas daechungensis]|uniref:oligosaccharide flippase family protein n=1 Tax=Sphingomonas daechungensis TaxID=1176646 RepID=UPI0037834734